MRFEKLPTSQRALWLMRQVEQGLNRAVRGRDGLKARLRLGGRKATRPGHVTRSFMEAETTRGERELAVEREIFAGEAAGAFVG